METIEKILGHISKMGSATLAFIVVLVALAVVWKALDRDARAPEREYQHSAPALPQNR